MSNLLSQASLVMIPSGYKEDIVYSQIPTDGSGDLSFTRASNGTRINSAGLVEVCPWNLLTYSEAFNNAVWTLFDISITANSTTAPNGTTTADKAVLSVANIAHFMLQDSSITSGIVYTQSFYVKASGYSFVQITGSTGFTTNYANFNLSDGTLGTTDGGTATITSVGNGWYRLTYTLTAQSTTTGRFLLAVVPSASSTRLQAFAGNGTDGVFLWGAQLNIGSTAKPYFPTTDRLNVPRLSYMYGSCPALLLEPQRTNLLLRSEEFDNSDWIKIATTITSNATTAPNGTTTAEKIIPSATSSSHSVYQTNGVIGDTRTMSCYVKKVDYRYVTLQYGTASSRFDFDTLTFAGGTNTGYDVLPNGWYRIYATLTATVNARASIAIPDNAGNFSYVGDGTSGTFIWGAQLELGAYPTTYIPTTTASATRVADVAQKTSISSLIGQTEGTIFLDTKYLASATASGRWFNVFGTINNIGLALNGVNSVRTIINGLSDTIATSPKTGLGVKIAFAYNATGVVCFINGTEYSLPNGSSETMTSLDSILFDAAANPQFQQGEVNSFILFKTRLTNAELASLTTI